MKVRVAVAVLSIPVVFWLINICFGLVNAASSISVLAGLAGLLGVIAMTYVGFRKLFMLAVLLAVVTTLPACTRVSPGYVGIVVNQWGTEKGVSDYTAKTGQFMYNPITTSVYHYPTFTQNYVWTHNPNEGSADNEEITFTIKGNMAISLDVSIAYSLDAAKVPAFYVQFRSDDITHFTNGYLHNVTRDCFNEIGGKYELDQIMGDNAEFIHAVRKELEVRVSQYGVVIGQFGVIGAPRPPKAVQDAINAKIGAVQLAIQKQNELVQATADANKSVAQAEGEARAITAKAKATADANRIISESLTDKLVQYEAIKKWNGYLPTAMGGTTVPFLDLTKK